MSTLHVCCDLTLMETLPEAQKIRLAAALQDINCGVNAVERSPCVSAQQTVISLSINEMTQWGGQTAGVAGVAPVVGVAAHGAVPKSIRLNQQFSNSQMALMQVQIDNGFATMTEAAHWVPKRDCQ